MRAARAVDLVIGLLDGLEGGTEQHLASLCRGLPKRGFEARVVCVFDHNCTLAAAGRRGIEKTDGMTVLRGDPAVTHVLARRRVLAVPQIANDIRHTRVSLVKADQNFIVQFWHEERTAVVAAHHGGDPNPIGFVVVIQPGKVHLDFSHIHLRYQPNDHTINVAH